jgi:hypothetical protein
VFSNDFPRNTRARRNLAETRVNRFEKGVMSKPRDAHMLNAWNQTPAKEYAHAGKKAVAVDTLEGDLKRYESLAVVVDSGG